MNNFIKAWKAFWIRQGFRSPCCYAPTESDNLGYNQLYCTKCGVRIS